MLDNNIIIQPYQLKSSKVMKTPYGLTVLEIVNQMYNQSNIPPQRRTYDVMVEVNGTPIPRDKWNFVPDVNSHVLVSTLMYGGNDEGGGGNKMILRVVMMIAVVVISFYAPYLAPALFLKAGGGLTLAGLGLTMAVMTAGSMLINAIAPIRPLETDMPGSNPNPKQVYSITGSQNRANPFGSIPVVLGRHKMYPVYGAAPYTEIVGNEEYLRMLFVWGYGPLKIEDIKIGDTLLSEYSDYEIETVEGRVGDPLITKMPLSVQQQQVNQELVDPLDEAFSKVKNGYSWQKTIFPFTEVSYWNTVGCNLDRVVGGYDGGKCAQLTSVSGTYQQIEQKIVGSKQLSYTVIAYVKNGTSTNGAYRIGIWSPSQKTWTTPDTTGVGTATTEWARVEFTFTYTHGDEYLVLQKNSSHASSPGTMLFDEVGVYKTDYSGLNWGDIIRTVEGADEISVDVFHPGGLYLLDSKGERHAADSGIKVEWREMVDGLPVTEWATILDPSWTHNTSKPQRKSFRITSVEGVSRTKTYEIKVVKDVYYPTGGDKVSNMLIWTTIRGIRNEHPIDFNLPLAMTAIRIRATQQLNGIINELSGIVSSYATVWDGDSWTGEAVSANPAALYRLVLMHPANVRARAIAQINDAELGAWYTFCETEGYKFNMIRESATSVWNTLADVASAGRGSPSLAEGLWGVVYDDPDALTVQHITPRNSWGFSSNKILFNPPHGFRIEFKNEDNDWKDDERIVLDDGYYLNTKNADGVTISIDTWGNIIDPDNPINPLNPLETLVEATQFESISLIGITDPDFIWRFGRYHIAQARLRPEVYTLSMDFEHLVCRRGSKVLVSHDVPMWGTKWGRIKSLVTESSTGSGTNVFEDQEGGASWEDTSSAEWDKGTTIVQVVGVKLDERFSITSSAQYVMRIRRSDDDTSQVINLATMPIGEYDTVLFETPLTVGNPLIPPVGDLVIIGEITKETNECLVRSIRSSDDLSATLDLVDLGSAIYEADQGEIPPFNTNITRVPDITLIIPTVPSILSVQSGTDTLELGISGNLAPRIFVTCGVDDTDIRIDSYEVSYQLNGTENWTTVRCKGDDPTAICTDVLEGSIYSIRARSVSIYGIFSEWSQTVLHTVVGQSELPDDVTHFTCNILGSEAHLSWYPVEDIDLSHYRIRQSPLTTGAIWEDSIDIIKCVAMPATSITVQAMVGSYLIKAVDYKGNESSIATTAKASVVRIPGFTTVDTVSQPTWSGTGISSEYSAELGGICLTLAPTGENLLINGEEFIGNSTNLISNGADFTGGPPPTGWTAERCTLAAVGSGQAGNCLEITVDDDPAHLTDQAAYQNITLTLGKSYRVSGYVKSGTSGNETFRIVAGGYQGYVEGTTSGDWTQYTFDFVCSDASCAVYLIKMTDTHGTMLFDTITLYELVTDWYGVDCTLDNVAGGQDGDCLQLTRVASTDQYAYQDLTLTGGKQYRLSYYVKQGTDTGANSTVIIRDVGVGDIETNTEATTASWVQYSIDFTAPDDGEVRIILDKNSANAGTMLYDEVTLYEITLAAEGQYTLSDEVDLGGVYTARISAALTTSATNLYSDLYDFIDLYSSTNLYEVPVGKCGIELEIRTTEDDPAGTPTWTEWSSVVVGDFTARAFQFRLYLWSVDSTITPVVGSVDIYVELADRTQGFTQEISVGGEDVVYEFPFFDPPSLSISVANQGTATYTITGQDREGFSIQFNTGTHNISGIAKGYGLEEV